MRQNIKNWRFWKTCFFLSLPFWNLTFKNIFSSIPWESVKGSWVARMGQNFDDYPGFKPKRPLANTYAQDCRDYRIFFQVYKLPDKILESNSMWIAEQSASNKKNSWVNIVSAFEAFEPLEKWKDLLFWAIWTTILLLVEQK